VSFSFLQFETIKVVETQNNDDLNSGKSELRELLKQKQSLEIKIQGEHSKVTTHKTHDHSAA